MGGLGGYGYENYLNKPSMSKTSPPLSAIQRFLLDNNKGHFSIKTPQNNNHVASQGEYRSNGNFNSGFGNTMFCDSESDLSWMHEMYPNLSLNPKGESLPPENSKYFGRKGKGSFIKGQWTDEEDRILVDLVIKHGEKRWAKVAEQMNGRAGKQCRERWHNHLRPDIKKDIWSEEEERMLIEAHIQVGNKWAEIAKRIPGRTENSIKNHWNATKRRQNSKRKCKKMQEGQKSKSMLLQEYQIKIFADKSNNSTPTGSTITEDKIDSFALSYEDSSVDDLQLFDQITHNDEQNFILNLFDKKNDQPSYENNNKQTMKDQSVGAYNDRGKIIIPNNFINRAEEELPARRYLPSDRYISSLLDWPTNNSPNSMNGYYDNFSLDFVGSSSNGMENRDFMEGYNGNFNVDFMGSSSNGKEDKDLMEMMASHHKSPFGGNTNLKL